LFICVYIYIWAVRGARRGRGGGEPRMRMIGSG